MAGALLALACTSAAPTHADVLLYDDRVLEIEPARLAAAAPAKGESLWLSERDLRKASGFVLKPEGLCLEDICVPVNPNAEDALVRRDAAGTRVDLAALARRLDQPYAVDASSAPPVWSFGPLPVERRAFREAAEAPDFELSDVQGRAWRLSSHRGNKLVLVAWASWCACRDDLPEWERLHRELGGAGFEIVTIAEDAEGLEAAGPFIAAADTSHTALIDPTHRITALYQLVNVPSAIWIDERGTIVRLDDGAYPRPREILGVTVGAEGYADALRDWVARGDESRYILTGAAMTAALRSPDRTRSLADQEFRLGSYFHQRGDSTRATAHWERAAELAPDNWNYRRQEWADSRFEATFKFLVRAFGRGVRGVPYYEPIELPPPDEASE